ncbi:MAG: TonB-dependent receptor [candidate division KSB1 bacterium]|nr:TonB-dependent receptor [candidate division KSB1 bacterium]
MPAISILIRKWTILVYIPLCSFGWALWLPELLLSQESLALIYGQVCDAHGHPMAYANVHLLQSFDGDVCDSTGLYRFRTRKFGQQRLRASMMGYESAEKAVVIRPGDTLRVDFILHETLILLKEAVVTASAFSTGDEKGVTLRSLDVVTTPGTAADIFLAIKTFPGVAMLDEGSGLFVRGGNVNETVTILDQATVVHPYKYESPTGGIFGTISPFLVKGTFFSSGGFSAKYGNALSGILDMQSQDMPPQEEYVLGLGLAAASLGLNTRLADGRLGLRFSGNRSFTDAMFRLNGRIDEFAVTPRSTDGHLSLIYRYSPTGSLKFFNFASTDRIGVHVNEPSFDGVYHGNETNRLHNLQWKDIFRGWLLKTSLSRNRFTARRRLGALDLTEGDITDKIRLDAEKAFGPRLQIAWGMEYEWTTNTFSGQIPVFSRVLDPQAEVWRIHERVRAGRQGLYAEANLQLSRRWFAGFGLRSDWHSLSRQRVVDPRLSLRFQLSRTTNLRLSWGMYHQFPQPYQYNTTSGNPGLRAQEARHLVLTFEHQKKHWHIRAEAYAKPYRHLVLPSLERNFISTGDGDTRGMDVFVKYGAYLLTRFNGWISYSFLKSRRLQARQLADRYVYERGPSPFDITHNLTVVAKTQLYQHWSFGLTYRYATGRPVTPVLGAVRQQPFDFYLPIEGPVGSERLPAFQRLDASLSLYYPFGNGSAAVFYLAVSNLLNRVNVLDWDYSVDYSERRPRETNYRRFVYFGVSVMLLGKTR